MNHTPRRAQDVPLPRFALDEVDDAAETAKRPSVSPARAEALLETPSLGPMVVAAPRSEATAPSPWPSASLPPPALVPGSIAPPAARPRFVQGAALVAVGVLVGAGLTAGLVLRPGTTASRGLERPRTPAPDVTAPVASVVAIARASATAVAVSALPSPVVVPSAAVAVSALPSPAFPRNRGRVLLPASARGHRVFVDGALATAVPEAGSDASAAELVVACGRRTIKIGSGGAARIFEVPCGGELDLR